MSEDVIKKPKEIDLKSIFYEVLKGYTVFSSEVLSKQCYIKHLNIYDNVETDKLYAECYEKAKEMGLPTETAQKEYLNKEKLWTIAQDAEIDELEKYISNLKNTKGKLFLKSQIEPIIKDIEESEQKLLIMHKERLEMMGYTAESYAHKRSNEIYMQKALYDSKDFDNYAMNSAEFDDVTDKQLSNLTIEYNKATEILSLETIKKISLMPFFCNYFYLCDDNPMTFFGKPVIELSFFQAELFAFGRYFKHLTQESKASPPDEIRNDPDKLIDFYEMRRTAEQVMEKLDSKSGDKAGGSSLVGATQEDLEAIGYSKNTGKTLSLRDVANKKGGNLSMDDFVDLHG